MSSQVQFVKSRQFCEVPEELITIKLAGVGKLRRVVHDGTCGYRCISDQDGVPLEDMVKKFINLCEHKDYSSAEVSNYLS
jgi:hypothetical protein